MSVDTNGLDDPGAGSPALPAELREISELDGERLVRILLGHTGSGSVVAWRRAQIVSLAAQRMSPAQIGEVAGADPATVWAVIAGFNRHGFDSLADISPTAEPEAPKTGSLDQRTERPRHPTARPFPHSAVGSP